MRGWRQWDLIRASVCEASVENVSLLRHAGTTNRRRVQEVGGRNGFVEKVMIMTFCNVLIFQRLSSAQRDIQNQNQKKV